MTSVVSEPSASPGEETIRPDPAGGLSPQGWAWHASRASAVLLVVLLPLHFVVTFLVDDVGTTTAATMSDRLDDPTWGVLTWFTLALALLHATLSSRRALRRVRPGPVGATVSAGVGVISVGLLVAATWALTTRG